MSARECFNLLAHGFFWAVRSELKAARFLGGISDDQRLWASVKPDIESRFGVSRHYLKNLRPMDREVTLSDAHAVMCWMVSVVGESHGDELYALVARLLAHLPRESTSVKGGEAKHKR